MIFYKTEKSLFIGNDASWHFNSSLFVHQDDDDSMMPCPHHHPITGVALPDLWCLALGVLVGQCAEAQVVGHQCDFDRIDSG